MKNAIAYYYNLYSYDIHQYKDVYNFSVGNAYYVLTPCNIDEINDIYELSQELTQRGIYIHQIIPNVSNNIYTTINNINYVLLRLYNNMNQTVTTYDVVKFNNDTLNINFNKLIRQNWALLWQNKIDYFEYQVSQFGKKYPLIRESFGYYVGLAETGISLYMNSKIETSVQTVSHKRIKTNSTLYDLYNPLNLVVDYKVRDMAEYFKDLFLVKEDIFGEILEYFQYQYLSTYDCFVFFVRMFYPSFYFDAFEKIIENQESEEKLQKIIEKNDSYEYLLKRLYIYLSNYINMPDIEWLKKI